MQNLHHLGALVLPDLKLTAIALFNLLWLYPCNGQQIGNDNR
jgi:hypothetical protein